MSQTSDVALLAGDDECAMVFIPYFNECLVGESDVSSGVEFGAFEGLRLVRKSAWTLKGASWTLVLFLPTAYCRSRTPDSLLGSARAGYGRKFTED